MPPQPMHDSQANLAFLRSQTEHIESEAYQTRYPDIQYSRLIPVDTSAPEFATAVTYVTVDSRGRADWINGGATDIPLVGLSRSETKTGVHTGAIGYDYTWEEVGQARMMGYRLDAEKANAARRIAEEFLERVAFSGDTPKGFQAFLNNAAITPANVANNAAGSSRLWANKTPLEILFDINDAINDVWSDSLTIEQADTVLIPPDSLAYIATTPMSADNSMTILRMIMESNLYTITTGQPLTIAAVRQLSTRGASGTRRMVTYRRAPDVVKMHLPMAHRFLPVEQVMLNFVVPGVLRTGGVDIRRPGAVRYRDGF